MWAREECSRYSLLRLKSMEECKSIFLRTRLLHVGSLSRERLQEWMFNMMGAILFHLSVLFVTGERDESIRDRRGALTEGEDTEVVIGAVDLCVAEKVL